MSIIYEARGYAYHVKQFPKCELPQPLNWYDSGLFPSLCVILKGTDELQDSNI